MKSVLLADGPMSGLLPLPPSVLQLSDVSGPPRRFLCLLDLHYWSCYKQQGPYQSYLFL